jgi:phosphoesterase RecJ-like protein
MLGLGMALTQAGNQVQMILTDGIPETYHFLDGYEKISKKLCEPVDLIIVVDCSEVSRVGEALPEGRIPDINIDHHITNTNFALINLVETDSAATAETITKYLSDFGLEWNQSVVDALMVGILSDTIGFRTKSMRSETLLRAAELMDRGADLPGIYKRILNQRSMNALRYWGAGLSMLQRDDRIIWTELTLADRKMANYFEKDDADLINILSAVNEADIALVFIEQVGGSVKISWRAQNGYDVSKVAVYFGGGGHRAAAGAEVEGNLAEIKQQVLAETKKYLLEQRDKNQVIFAG